MFNEFKQANAEIRGKYGGTGLGLSISKQLTKLMGGELLVDSKIGDGSSFHFILDFKRVKGKIDSITPLKEIEKLRLESCKILIVEDNKMNLKYITSLLNKWNLNFEVCMNGQEACDITAEKKFDLIFMDLQMPLMDGFEASQVIRSRENQNQNIPIIALTASTFLSKKRLALKAGMSDFLSKPFTPNQLFDVISKFLGKKNTVPISKKEFAFSTQLDTDYLYKIYGTDSNYAQDMIETFLEIIDDEMLVLKDSLVQSDKKDLIKKLHKIKPTFAMVGLNKIALNIENVESRLQNEESLVLSLWFEELEELLLFYKPILKSEVKKLIQWQRS